MNENLSRMILPQRLQMLTAMAGKITIPETRNSLLEMAMGSPDTDLFEVL
jgi:hypothetical protein